METAASGAYGRGGSAQPTLIGLCLTCSWASRDETGKPVRQLKVDVWKRQKKDWRLLCSTVCPTKPSRSDESDVECELTTEVEHCFHRPAQFKVIVGNDVGSKSNDGKRRGSNSGRRIRGEALFDLATLVSARAMHLTLPIISEEHEEELGNVDVRGSEVSNTRDVACLYFRARRLAKAGDAALAIATSDGEQFGRTEFVFGTVLGTTEPIWKPLQVPVRYLCAREDQRLRIDCLLNSSFTGPYSIGHCEVSSSDLFQAEADTPFQLSAADGSSAGTVNLLHYHLIKRYSFLDYVSGGCEITLMVAIDFTASNGHPSKRNSLHYVGGTGLNQYEMAMRAAAEPLSYYCASKNILAYGYGAETPGERIVSHCFPLNFDDQKPETTGIDGLLDSYKAALQQVKLRGPTHFAQIIDKASCYSANGPVGGGQSHLVLLIITDGIINDIEETEFHLEEASALPLSILIVGVGDADFTNMDLLCEKHSNVRFVPMAEYVDRPLNDLSEELLKDIPQQLVRYMHTNQLLPMELPPSSLPTMFEDLSHDDRDAQLDEDVKTEPPQWDDDQSVSHCTRCQSEFTFLWRRHHCRYCGGIFCDTCSQYSARLPFSPDPTPQRVCDECYAALIRIHYPCK